MNKRLRYALMLAILTTPTVAISSLIIDSFKVDTISLIIVFIGAFLGGLLVFEFTKKKGA